ncbi:MAG TPA: DUF4396 domain-containing protein [Gammaproteobacteria bacterium]|nr:DUF4396 domain-containing protein [Gammaproteobacteria bacterium]
MIDGIMTTWFVLTGLSLAFVVFDIPKTPESVVLKWAFVILVVFTGPLGAFFYVLGCREPLKGTHEQYVATTWRQVLGSTMHCAAGDGVGIIAGAAIGAALHLSAWGDFALEYFLGFGFGWAYFQAFAMRDMVGGSYLRSLKETFIPELLSMNLLMAGMIPTMKWLMSGVEGAADPARLAFWFTMSMALIVGFVLAYPVNWWLVVNHLKHGMLTVRPSEDDAVPGHGEHASGAGHGAHGGHGGGNHGGHGAGERPGAEVIAMAVLISYGFLFAGLWFAGGFFD